MPEVSGLHKQSQSIARWHDYPISFTCPKRGAAHNFGCMQTRQRRPPSKPSALLQRHSKGFGAVMHRWGEGPAAMSTRADAMHQHVTFGLRCPSNIIR